MLLDTNAHAAYVADLFRLPASRLGAFWVGAETSQFPRAVTPPPTAPVRVLFYGQFIPLHGLDIIVKAIALIAARSDAPALHFTIVGSGQEQPRIDALIRASGLDAIERIDWVDYHRLAELIAQSSICLGVFAADGKAARVIPNKVFQIMAVGRPLVTMDSPALREIARPGPALRLVPPGDAAALADALIAMGRDLTAPGGSEALHAAALAAMPIVDETTVLSQFKSATETLK